MTLALMTGCINEPLEAVRLVIEATDAFALIAPNAGTNKTFYYHALDRDEFSETSNITELRPLVLITPEWPVGIQKVTQAAGGLGVTSGSTIVYIQKNISELKDQYPLTTTTTEEILVQWNNLVGDLVGQFHEKAQEIHKVDTANLVPFNSGKNAEEERTAKGSFVGMEFRVEWGPTI